MLRDVILNCMVVKIDVNKIFTSVLPVFVCLLASLLA